MKRTAFFPTPTNAGSMINTVMPHLIRLQAQAMVDSAAADSVISMLTSVIFSVHSSAADSVAVPHPVHHVMHLSAVTISVII